MSTDPGRRPGFLPAEAVVKVRVSGDVPGIAAVVRLLQEAAETGGLGLEASPRLYPNRNEPGYRLYLTLLLPREVPADDMRRAAHSHQAIRRPAAPRPVKERPGKRHHP